MKLARELPRAFWPSALRHPLVLGVCLESCILGWTFDQRESAHAHVGGEANGYICFRLARFCVCPPLCYHEVAHLVTGKPGHGVEWREACLALGGTLDAVPDVLRSYRPPAFEWPKPPTLRMIGQLA